MACGIRLPTVPTCGKTLADWGHPLQMFEMLTPNFGDGGNYIAGYTGAADDMVRSGLVDRCAEKRGKRQRVTRSNWAQQLPDRLGVVAQNPQDYGSSAQIAFVRHR